MELGNIIYIIAIVLAFLIPLVFYGVNLKNAKENIKMYLSKRGATNINVHHDWFDVDRDTLTFDVIYTGVKGNKVATRCKLHHWGFFVGAEIFWAEPLNLELVQIAEELPRSEYYEFSERIRSHRSMELPTYEISAVLPIPNSTDQIVMMKYVEAFKNILRCRPDGTVIWQAELPTASGDVYTNVEWKDKHLTAYSRSLIAVHLDVETGRILPTSSVQKQNTPHR